ncbi:nickel pincer cofactor biosynthesis protein LarB [Desulfovibrio sp. X2]|uniref:nickel pincer cofactor biosynthesis protein LarB n=1 Tax=Desulfovibrio sp. X2 TaxID=941449 RepID=UPI0004099D84|nr:nickel pincer cofactor biosynthesis protein LarB [Desulfovibrio sp. X2]
MDTMTNETTKDAANETAKCAAHEDLGGTEASLRALLGAVRDGGLDVEQGMERLRDLPFLDLGHTKLDLHRSLRNGFPEVVYGAGKTPEQMVEIFLRLRDHDHVLATRVPPETALRVQEACPGAEYNPVARTLTLVRGEIAYRGGEICIVTAGTSDLPVAEEARVTCAMLGSRAFVVSDVGVAGIHRLLDRLDRIRQASVIVVVAGMEGALASVVGGLVSTPIIAVPTSVGYGASFGGLSALLGMLTSCASGVSVVNIDNGFGAACAACKINNLVAARS